MQRIWATWEAIAGPFVPNPNPQPLNPKPKSAQPEAYTLNLKRYTRFVLDTPLINVVYILLGARVSRNPKSER